MNPLIGGVALFLVGFVLGRITAPRERTSVTVMSAPPQDNPAANAEIERLVKNGNKIAAIKLYRKSYGTGLKDAKEAVDAIAARLS